MKKLLIVFVLGLLSFNANAEDTEYSVQIRPTNISSGKTISEKTQALKLCIHEGDNFAINTIVAMTLYVYLPENIKAIASEYDEDEEDYIDKSIIEPTGCGFASTASVTRTWGIMKAGAAAQDMAGYTKYIVSAYGSSATTKVLRNRNSYAMEEFCQFYVNTESATAGVYPVYVSTVSMAISGTASYDIDERTASYVVVDSPENATANLSGKVSSIVLSKTGSNNLSKVSLAEATEIYGTLPLTDGVELVAPTASVTIPEVTYNRTVTEGAYASIILPAAVSDGTFYVWDGNGKDAQGNVTFKEQTGLAANTPAIVIADVAVTQANVALEGNVSKQTITEGYYLKNNYMKKVNGNAIINPYRASWILPAGVKGFNLNTADGIKSVSLDEVEGADIYDLSGRKLNKAAKGVNIIGGQKVLRK